MPLTYGPETPAEDEKVIAKGYSALLGLALPFVPLAMALAGADTRWIVAVGFAALLQLQNEAGGRLHDLTIRLRRTNISLRDRS